MPGKTSTGSAAAATGKQPARIPAITAAANPRTARTSTPIRQEPAQCRPAFRLPTLADAGEPIGWDRAAAGPRAARSHSRSGNRQHFSGVDQIRVGDAAGIGDDLVLAAVAV